MNKKSSPYSLKIPQRIILYDKTYLTLSCSANQWTGFYMIGTSVMKKLSES